MSKANVYEADILKILLNATALANVFDNASSSPLTFIQASLHTADPGETGDQTTNEATYGGYARTAVARTTSGFSVATSGVATPVANISFPEATGGTSAVTHFGLGSATSGAGKLFYYGTLTPNITVTSGVTPSITTASTITET